MNIEEIKDGYFNYLVNEMLQALMEADGYDCKDFLALKLELVNNLALLMKSREHYNEAMQTLRENENSNGRCRK